MKITAMSLLARLGLAGGLLLAAACGSGPDTSSRPVSPASGAPAPQVEPGRNDLPDSAYQVEWAAFDVPATLKAGASAQVAVAFKNSSSSTWPSGAGTAGQLYTVRLTHRWLKPAGKAKAKGAKPEPTEVVGYGEHRVELPHAIVAGESVTIADTLLAPAKPGHYLVQFELAYEGVAWFSDKGAAKKLSPVTVQ